MRVPIHAGTWLDLPDSEQNAALVTMRRRDDDFHHTRRLTRDEVLVVADPRPWMATPRGNGKVTKHYGPGNHPGTGSPQTEHGRKGGGQQHLSATQPTLLNADAGEGQFRRRPDGSRTWQEASTGERPMPLSGERMQRISALLVDMDDISSGPTDWTHPPERREATAKYTASRAELHELLSVLDDEDVAWLQSRANQHRTERLLLAETLAARLQAKHGDITIDFTGIHPDLVPGFVAETDRLLTDYGIDAVAFIGTGIHPQYRFFEAQLEEDRLHHQMGRGAWVPEEHQWNGVTSIPSRSAADGDDRPRIFLNDYMTSDPVRIQTVLSQHAAQGWSVIETPADVLTHEFGHALTSDFAPQVHQVNDGVWSDTFKTMGSIYGFSEWDEGMAELFTYYTKHTRPLIDAAVAAGEDPKGAIESWLDSDPVAAINVAAGEAFERIGWNRRSTGPPDENVQRILDVLGIAKHPGPGGSELHSTGTTQVEAHGQGKSGAAASYERVPYPRLTNPNEVDEADDTHALHDPWEHYTEKEQVAIQAVMSRIAEMFPTSLVAQGASEQGGKLVADRHRTAAIVADLFRQAMAETPDELREAAIRWYHDAHDLAQGLADAYQYQGKQLTLAQTVGVIAGLSAGSSWSNEGESEVADNRSIAEMVIRTVCEDPEFEWTARQAEALEEKYGFDTTDLIGRVKLSQLPVEAVLFPHPSDETENPNLWKGEGDLGAGGKMAGSTGFMQNLMTSIRILRSDGSIEAIDGIIGGPKYRSFFNNIYDPDNAHNSTIDIWMGRIFANDPQMDFKGNREDPAADIADPDVDRYLDTQGKTIGDMKDSRKQYKRAVFMDGRGMSGSLGYRVGNTGGRLGTNDTKSAIGSNLGPYWWYDSVVQLAHDIAMTDPNYEGPQMTPSAFQSVLWNWVKFVRDW